MWEGDSNFLCMIPLMHKEGSHGLSNRYHRVMVFFGQVSFWEESWHAHHRLQSQSLRLRWRVSSLEPVQNALAGVLKLVRLRRAHTHNQTNV